MIYVTGDMHGEFSRLNNNNYGKYLTKDDYIIITGDFGLIWAYDNIYQYWLNWFKEKEFTVLFIDGNHENFDMLNEFKVTQWNCGKVHKILDNVIHLMRGQYFVIDDVSIFTFGGAQSTDVSGGILDKLDPLYESKLKQCNKDRSLYRINHETWWKEELPSVEELSEGLQVLASHGNKVDYVIAHALPWSQLGTCGALTSKIMKAGPIEKQLEYIEQEIEFKRWYCGHYHTDLALDSKHTVLYKCVKELGL